MKRKWIIIPAVLVAALTFSACTRISKSGGANDQSKNTGSSGASTSQASGTGQDASQAAGSGSDQSTAGAAPQEIVGVTQGGAGSSSGSGGGASTDSTQSQGGASGAGAQSQGSTGTGGSIDGGTVDGSDGEGIDPNQTYDIDNQSAELPDMTEDDDPGAWEGTFKSESGEQITLDRADEYTFSFVFANSGLYGLADCDGSDAIFNGEDNTHIHFHQDGDTISITLSNDDGNPTDGSPLIGTYYRI